MLHHTFSHVPGIGRQRERRLWEAGIHTWEDYRRAPQAVPFPASLHRRMATVLAESTRRLAGDPDYFCRLLPPARHWRLFPHYRERTVFLDIETDGSRDNRPTVVGLYDGRTPTVFVHDAGDVPAPLGPVEDLCALPDVLDQALVVVTFNGKAFDLPVLEGFFGRRFPLVHLDLYHLCRSHGIRGGLKRVEEHFHLHRGPLAGCDGGDAVALWWAWRTTGEVKALETLLAYNLLDTVNLEPVMVALYNHLVERLPFGAALRLATPAPPAIPYRPDPELVSRLRHGWNITRPAPW